MMYRRKEPVGCVVDEFDAWNGKQNRPLRAVVDNVDRIETVNNSRDVETGEPVIWVTDVAGHRTLVIPSKDYLWDADGGRVVVMTSESFNNVFEEVPE